jgi:hypothetical protein
MAAVGVDWLGEEDTLAGLRALLLGLWQELDLAGNAFYGLELDEFLATEFFASSLDLLDARRKTADFAFCVREQLRLLRARLACSMAAQGLGTSKNSASALTSTPSTAKPSETTSLQAEEIWLSLRSSKNFLVIYARCWLNSKVKRFPVGPMVYAMAQERDPEPVPASITRMPGASSSLKTMAELSMAKRICVFRARVSVMRVDLGLMGVMCLPGLL